MESASKPKIPDFLDFLYDEQVVGDEAYREIRKLQDKSPLPVDRILLKKGVADEETLLKALAKHFGFEYTSHVEYKPDPVLDRVPVNLIKKSRIIPFQFKKDTVHLVLRDPDEIQYFDDIRNILRDYQFKVYLTTEAEITSLIHNQFEQATTAAEDVMEGLSGEDFADLESLTEDTLDLANEAPIIRMVNAVLSQGVQDRASDIHIEPFDRQVDIRYRIDGILHRRLSPPRAIHSGLVSRIKIMANLNIAENRLPQDGRIKLKIAGKDIDIRVSTIPTRYGERVVMRLLNKTDVNFSMDRMGYDDALKNRLNELIQEPNGILLVTGPTGSGKSTTIYSFLTELNDEHRNILTAEDPVEYEITGISQMQMQEKVGLTFASALRAMLRQDPDVIMVGEIRDQETARIAIQASLTGHLVLSTLHTNDSPSAVTRLLDMGIEPYMITGTVRAVLAQRLVRRICDHCKESYKPDAADLAKLGLKNDTKLKIYRGEGCEKCAHTGYRGRTGLFELFEMDTDMQSAILEGADVERLRKIARSKKIPDLLEYGVSKVLEGVTTVEEVLRVT